MAQRVVSSSGWPWKTVLVLAVFGLLLVALFPWLLFVLIPTASAALIAWGYVVRRNATEPGNKARGTAAIACGFVLLAVFVLLALGLTVASTETTFTVGEPTMAPPAP